MQPSNTNGNSRGGMTHGGFASPLRFPGEDGGRSLAEIAQRDLDAALQLLADRAQYITGASGAAIALKRNGMNDMLCRASTGENAPELGALLSTEFGLSGESVRTRRALQCDDAERDARVNREVCRQLGIASVVVMPVVNDDEVLGVFELFSGKANAFGERDLSAVKRLTEMVQAAVRLAHAAETLPAQLATELSLGREHSEAKVEAAKVEEPVHEEQGAEEEILDLDGLEERPAEIAQATKQEAEKAAELTAAVTSSVADTTVLAVLPTPAAETSAPAPAIGGQADAPQSLAVETADRPGAEIERAAEVQAPVEATSPAETPSKVEVEPQGQPKPQAEIQTQAGATVQAEVETQPDVKPAMSPEAVLPKNPEVVLPKKKLFWSAALNLHPDTGAPPEADQSHVPPMLRGLRKCEACGFPVSAGRVLCVECEEKKWRGQLKRSQAGTAAASRVSSGAVSSGQAFAAAAAAMKVAAPAETLQKSAVAPSSVADEAVNKGVSPEAAAVSSSVLAGEPGAALVFSAGLEPPASWLASHKYIVGVLLAVIAVVIAVVVFR